MRSALVPAEPSIEVSLVLDFAVLALDGILDLGKLCQPVAGSVVLQEGADVEPWRWCPGAIGDVCLVLGYQGAERALCCWSPSRIPELGGTGRNRGAVEYADLTNDILELCHE